MKAELEGLQELQRALRDKIKDIGEEIPDRFVSNALRMIEAHTAPYVPVDNSALINSAVRRVFPGVSGASGELSYGGTGAVDYAAYVHDGPQKNWQKAGASNLFLEHGVRDFIEEDLDALIEAEFGRIGG